jgi:antitoxin component of RelBE/YafQ-DinJ toxin-antitoxin module
MVNPARTKQIAIRLSDDEARVVEAVSAETGLTVSDVFRQALRKAHADRFAAKPKPRKK